MTRSTIPGKPRPEERRRLAATSSSRNGTHVPPSVPRPGRLVKPASRLPDWQRLKLRKFILKRLRESDGITYDQLCHDTAARVRHPNKYYRSQNGVKEVRKVLWDRLAVTEPDESVWLTPAGWRAK